MQDLFKGVQLYFYPESINSIHKMELSAGTRTATLKEQHDNQYASGAYLPKPPWRSLSPLEQTKLVRDSPPRDYSRTVCVMSMPHNIITPLQALCDEELSKSSSRWDVISACMAGMEKTKAIIDLRHYLKSFSPQDPATFSAININQKNLTTVTFDPESNQYIGLHLDNWDQLPLQKRYLATNRICINLGRSDRYFLFINLTLIDMLNAICCDGKAEANRWNQFFTWLRHKTLPTSHPSFPKASPVKLHQVFMQRFPDYPVVRVRIAPGEGYIAPTENIIHDGSSLGSATPDVQTTLRGHFKLPV